MSSANDNLDFTAELVALAFKEDLPQGDLTTELLTSELLGSNQLGRIKIIAKEDLVLSGIRPFGLAIHSKAPDAKINWSFADGDVILAGQIACVLHADQKQILSCERVALNFLGHLSGVATLTRSFVNQLTDTDIKLLDTRKTTPGYRFLEKRAVLHGGGTNHRMNLSEAVLIKDNHIALAGGVGAAITQIQRKHDGPIEVEVERIDQLKECLHYSVQRILLDNMDNAAIQSACEIIPPGIQIEVSGGITFERLAQLKKLPIHFISVGEITHSAPTVDFSMEFDW